MIGSRFTVLRPRSLNYKPVILFSGSMIGRPLHRRVIAGLNCIKRKKKKKEKEKKGVFLDIKRNY